MVDELQLDMFRNDDEPSDTLSVARRRLFEGNGVGEPQWIEGVECPCCGRTVKLRPRPLNKGMTCMLIWMCRRAISAGSNDWINPTVLAPRWLTRSHDWYDLRYWGLAELKPKLATDPQDPPGKTRTSGLWKPTDQGFSFVRGEIRKPSHANVFNKHCYGFSDELVSVADALGVPFNFAELVAGRAQQPNPEELPTRRRRKKKRGDDDPDGVTVRL